MPLTPSTSPCAAPFWGAQLVPLSARQGANGQAKERYRGRRAPARAPISLLLLARRESRGPSSLSATGAWGRQGLQLPDRASRARWAAHPGRDPAPLRPASGRRASSLTRLG